MNKKGNARIVAVIVVALAILGSIFLIGRGGSNTNPTPTPTVTPPAPGAVSSADIFSPYLCVNGVCEFFNRKAFNQASTTICSIKSPNATSTLRRPAGVTMAVSTTSASILTIARAATPFATTTLIGSALGIAANAQANFVASTTATQDASGAAIFPPNTYLNFSLQGNPGTYSPVGSCHGDFTIL